MGEILFHAFHFFMDFFESDLVLPVMLCIGLMIYATVRRKEVRDEKQDG